MQLTVQKRLAAQILKCSEKKIAFDPNRLDEIKEAITKFDIRTLIKKGVIIKKGLKGVSRGRARRLQKQKSKGKRKGHGSRKGASKARKSKKEAWVEGVRLQRKFIKALKEKKIINNKIYRMFYSKIKSGVFRSKRHIKLYMEELRIGKK